MSEKEIPPRGGIFLLSDCLGRRRFRAGSAGPVKVNKSFRLPVAIYRSYLGPRRAPVGSAARGGKRYVDRPVDSQFNATNWRISTFNGALLAAYFVPTWTIVAFKIAVSPVHGFYERPNISVALYLNDHLHVAATRPHRDLHGCWRSAG